MTEIKYKNIEKLNSILSDKLYFNIMIGKLFIMNDFIYE